MLGSYGLAMEMVDEVSSPAMPTSREPIDRGHLSRMTLGERSLEREVLALFDRQADILLNRMNSAAPSGVTTLAHTLKGSAVGIGAWGVARAAEAVEQANAAGLPGAIAALGAAIADVKQAIAGLLRAH
jgi:HPt (histidine-containing phosphotransfer) domain-containing protein